VTNYLNRKERNDVRGLTRAEDEGESNVAHVISFPSWQHVVLERAATRRLSYPDTSHTGSLRFPGVTQFRLSRRSRPTPAWRTPTRVVVRLSFLSFLSFSIAHYRVASGDWIVISWPFRISVRVDGARTKHGRSRVLLFGNVSSISTGCSSYFSSTRCVVAEKRTDGPEGILAFSKQTRAVH